MAIFQCNSVTLREYDKLRGKELGSGVFPTIARINHSCVPNTVLSYNLETKECEVIFILINCLIVMIVVFNFLPIHNEKCSTALTIHRRTNFKDSKLCLCVSVCHLESYQSALSFCFRYEQAKISRKERRYSWHMLIL